MYIRLTLSYISHKLIIRQKVTNNKDLNNTLQLRESEFYGLWLWVLVPLKNNQSVSLYDQIHE